MTQKAAGRERAEPSIRHWKHRDDYLSGSLKVDEIVQRLALSEGPGLLDYWDGRHRYATGLVRISLQVAISRASDQRIEHETGETIADWEHTAELAADAHAALDRLLRNYVPIHNIENLLLPLRTSRAFGSYDGEKESRVRAAANALWQARLVASNLSQAAKARSREMKNGRKNPRKHDFLIFCKTVGVAWVHLTGTRPPASRTGNLFQQFLYLSWLDAGGKIVGPKQEDIDGVSVFFGGAKEAREAWSDQQIQAVIADPGQPDGWPPIESVRT